MDGNGEQHRLAALLCGAEGRVEERGIGEKVSASANGQTEGALSHDSRLKLRLPL